MEIKFVSLYAVGGELFTWEGLDTFKINKSKIEYLYVNAPKLEIKEGLYLVKGKHVIKGEEVTGVELIKYVGYGRYISLGNIDEDTLKTFMGF